MKVNILLNNPVSKGRFAETKLSFNDREGNMRIVTLNISFQALKDFSNDTTSLAFDFFFISTLVYGIDNLLDRYEYSIDGWARDIEVCFPVNNYQVWENNQCKLESLLTFLTGDYWNISFDQIDRINLFTDKAKRWKSKIPTYNFADYKFVSLFSGGLDSLIGVIDGLVSLNDNEKGLLISHFDSSSPGANSDQERINNYLLGKQDFGSKYHWIQCIVALANQDNSGNELVKESSFRSRSLLFIGLALFCVEALPNCNTLTIPENGTISLNFPLTPSRTSSLSTRTTHPYYLQKLQNLFSSIGLSTELFNPYKNFTKGEMVEECSKQSVLKEIYAQSVSCGKRGRKMQWDTKSGTHHCGICMPCIYRRAALHKINIDTQLYGIDIFTTPNFIFDKYDFPALFDFLNKTLTTEQIKRTLLVAGSISMDDLDNAASLVERVREEIKRWITDKGNESLKQLAGIQ